MSERWPGGIISKTAPTPSGPYQNSTAPGIWTLEQQAFWAKQGQWPTAGNLNPSADPFFANVSLLLHLDGTSGQTTFTDSSSNNFAISRNGNAQVSTSVVKFGTGSGSFDGSGDYIYTTNASSAFNYGNGDFTIEFWVYPLSGPVSTYDPCFYTNHGDGDWNSAGAGIRIHHQNVIFGGSFQQINFSPAIQNNVWTYIAIVRSGNTITAYVNGVSQGSITRTTVVGDNSDRPALATADSITTNGREWLNGYIDELRITKGVARYTSNFTPPTQAFPNS